MKMHMPARHYEVQETFSNQHTVSEAPSVNGEKTSRTVANSQNARTVKSNSIRIARPIDIIAIDPFDIISKTLLDRERKNHTQPLTILAIRRRLSESTHGNRHQALRLGDVEGRETRNGLLGR